MKYALGLFIVLPGLFFLHMLLTAGGDTGVLSDFIHAPSLLAMLTAVFGVIVLTGEFKTYVKVVNALFSKKYVISAEDKEKGIKLLQLSTKVVLYAAVFYLVMVAIIFLPEIYNNADFDHTILAVMAAIGLLAPLYALVMNMIFFLPAIHILKNRESIEEKSAKINEEQVVNKLLGLCYKQGISPEEILNADEIAFRNR